MKESCQTARIADLMVVCTRFILVVYILYFKLHQNYARSGIATRYHVTGPHLLRNFRKIYKKLELVFQDTARRAFSKSDWISVGAKIRFQQSCGLNLQEMSQKIDICKFAANFMCKLGGPWDRCKFALQIRTQSYFTQHYSLQQPTQ